MPGLVILIAQANNFLPDLNGCKGMKRQQVRMILNSSYMKFINSWKWRMFSGNKEGSGIGTCMEIETLNVSIHGLVREEEATKSRVSLMLITISGQSRMTLEEHSQLTSSRSFPQIVQWEWTPAL
jgi:hypothetical protein